jgi:hypothetical protein
LFLLHHCQVHASTQAAHGAGEVAVNCSLSWSHLSIKYFSSDSSHVNGA